MPKFPTISGKEFIKFLEKLGFIDIRVRGSHHRLSQTDGRKTTIPVHSNQDLPIGLIKKILNEDIQIKDEIFINYFHK